MSCGAHGISCPKFGQIGLTHVLTHMRKNAGGAERTQWNFLRKNVPKYRDSR